MAECFLAKFVKRDGIRSCQIKILLMIFLAGMQMTAASAAPDRNDYLSQKIRIESLVEDHIRSIIGDQLSAGEYFVHCSLLSKTSNERTAKAKNETATLPFTPVKVQVSSLQKMFDSNNLALDINDLELRVELVMDERIPDEKRKLLEGVVRDRFAFDGKKRTLVVRTMALVQPPLALEKSLAMEKERLANEAVRLQVEAQRTQLEMTKREIEMERKLAEAQQQVSRAESTVRKSEAEAEKKEEKKQEEKTEVAKEGATKEILVPAAKTSLDHLRDFQLLLVAFFLGLIGVVFLFLGDRMFKKGFSPLAAAFENIGGALGKMKVGGAAAPAAAPAAAAAADHGAGHHGPAMHGGQPAAAAHVDEADAAETKEFMRMVTEKVQVLVKEQNFNFYRHLLEWIDNDASLPLAAALFTALDGAVAKILTQAISIDHVDRIRRFLSSPGGVGRAKELRKQALQEFFGRISMDEFSSSAIGELKNMGWFTRMSTNQMRDFVVQISDSQRAALLACLSPARISMLMEKTTSSGDRKKILNALQGLDKLTNEQIRSAITELATSSKIPKQEVDSKPVDSARIMAAVMESLTAEEQQGMLENLNRDKALAARIRELFVPFSTLARLPKELILEIFVERSDGQIALILFAANEDVRRAVIGALPEIRAASIEDELKLLDAKAFYKSRNNALSLQLQKEIGVFLLKLAKEGLLDVSAEANLRAVGEGSSGAA